MSNIERPRHTLPSAHQPPFNFRPAQDLVSGEEEEQSDDHRTLAEVIRSNKIGTSQEGSNSPNLLPSHPKKARVTTRKRRASASPSDSDSTPRLEPFLDSLVSSVVITS
jgi:hypothetical protein